MRYFLLLIAIGITPSLSLANELDDQINKACLRHSVSLVARLKNEVINNLDKSQSDEALKIATESCQAYFKKEFSGNAVTTVAEDQKQAEEEGGIKDWLTESILSGDSSRKEGNKRLDKLRNK